MISRRRTLLTATAFVAAPAVLRASVPLNSVLDDAAALDQLHAVLISQNGNEIAARRFRGPSLTRAVNVKSVSKSIVAALAGATIDRGIVPDVTATLGDIAPELLPRNADPRVSEITIEDLLTLRAGLERTSGANYGGWISSPNWVADALSRPFVGTPGGAMLYSTGSTHVLGAALAKASGDSLLSMSRNWLGGPLGIDIPAWTRDPQGFYLGGNEMALTPAAMLRFGEMMRRGGLAADGTRVLSEDWITASFVPRTLSRWSGLGYGYGWFLGNVRGDDFALARGYGGQIIAVVPNRELTLVITSDPTRPARSGGYFSDLMRLLDQCVAALE